MTITLAFGSAAHPARLRTNRPVGEIDVCRAGANDTAEVCRLLRRSISEVCGPDYADDPTILAEWLCNKTLQNVRRWIVDENNYAVVATRLDAVVGFALLRGNVIVLNYAVPECLGIGVGHLMLEALEQWATAQGFCELRCMSTITARSFYGRHGFEQCGEPVCVGGIVCEIHLRKRIDI